MKLVGAVAVAAALAMTPAVDASLVAGPRFVGGVNGSLATVGVGDLVAQGVPRDGSCHFPGTTTFGAEGLTRTMHITTLVTPTCAMVVDAIGPVQETADAGTNDQPVEVGAGAGFHFLVDPDTNTGPVLDAVAEPRTKVPRKGETEFTILEQFNITAYELHLELAALQDTYTGDISDPNINGSYCYVSGFPGNQIKSCSGYYTSRGGDYAEFVARGKFDNNRVGGPEMLLETVHIITRSNSGGRCALVEGDYPPFWRGDCKISRVQ